MTGAITWDALHDATLEKAELLWSNGELTVRFRTGSAENPTVELTANAMRRLILDRQMPWGYSVSVNEVATNRFVGFLEGALSTR
jgi:hypothetical protein